ncbi:lipoprotein-releasing ABC transporter permease subunit [Psychromonas sp. RZ22]|uniref:lipoprotein-releasing ABC transporter permease subunit n=1 Tax=Psychromonas algarum TaxID=2555643 RepID=UPI001067C62D|nr:lipoprotein-releasing ABC transporter permease subunit [Psychromonas sp. RZ22]TEW56105.1 lipoprotein-releasing ABC transporter permease subunit [Psychromonas sp. RZ22]
MFYPLSVFIGLRYTKSKRNNQFVSFVSLFSTGGIILGVLALITVLSVMNGFEGELKQRILGSIPQAKLSNQQHIIDHWQQRIDNLPPNLQVIAVEPMINAEAIIQSPNNLQGALVEGIYPDKYASHTVKDSIYMGELNDLQAGEYRVIIGHQLATQLKVHLGDKVRIISTRGARYTPLGQVPSQRNFTVAGMFEVGSDVDSHLVLMHAQDAARLIRLQPQQVTDLRFYFNDPFAVESWQHPSLDAGETLVDWRSTHGELFAAVKMEKNMIWLLLCLIIAVAAFNILSSSVMVVTDKSAEVAILKTLGIQASTINFIFILQGAFSGIIGALIGTGLGLLLSTYINEVMSFLGLHVLSNASGGARVLPVIHEPVQIAFIMFGAMLLSLLATLYPAYRAGKVSPVEALRYE